MKVTVLIIGAGPAGLTAALELLRASDKHRAVVIEALDQVGGLARTVRHNGNRMDIGGHRFFSKVDWVMDWWREILPLSPSMKQFMPAGDASASLALADALAAGTPHDSLLVRPRLSRIYYLRKFFDYPISLTARTIRNLGVGRMARIGASYARARARPIKPERHLEDFLINRFGRRLYRTFFKAYTEKVWGVSCDRIDPQWGAQRIKGLSVRTALVHAIRKLFRRGENDLEQRKTETSLIEKFMYPKYGPGQMWEVVADKVRDHGGQLLLGVRLVALKRSGSRIVGAIYEDVRSLERTEIACASVISTMPLKDLALALTPAPSEDILEVAVGLAYRDFITVGVLLRKLRPSAYVRQGFVNNMFPDTWIYIQEDDVKLGRLQVFNNWSPSLVADGSTIWLGLEYFCTAGDELWKRSESEIQELARDELQKLGLANAEDVLDMKVIKVEKAYPAYFGSFDRLGELRSFLDTIENLYPVGRNGMHRYNNQDHSMVSARLAVECILDSSRDKADIWNVNVEQAYHESR